MAKGKLWCAAVMSFGGVTVCMLAVGQASSACSACSRVAPSCGCAVTALRPLTRAKDAGASHLGACAHRQQKRPRKQRRRPQHARCAAPRVPAGVAVNAAAWRARGRAASAQRACVSVQGGRSTQEMRTHAARHGAPVVHEELAGRVFVAAVRRGGGGERRAPARRAPLPRGGHARRHAARGRRGLHRFVGHAMHARDGAAGARFNPAQPRQTY